MKKLVLSEFVFSSTSDKEVVGKAKQIADTGREAVIRIGGSSLVLSKLHGSLPFDTKIEREVGIATLLRLAEDMAWLQVSIEEVEKD